MSNDRQTIEKLLQEAGVKLNGPSKYDPQVHNERFYKRVFSQGSLGIGESYMDKWWDCEELDELFYRVHSAGVDGKFGVNWPIIKMYVMARLANMQSSARAGANADVPYNAGNDLYRGMLDKRMTYSCGYWKDAKNLDEAQEAKLDLVCRKLQLKPGTRVLDIGCGWGAFAEYAATKYKVEVTGITPAREQAKEAKRRTRDLPVTILQKSYQQLKTDKRYDAVVSIGMLEHVGNKNWNQFFELCKQWLKDDGIMLHHFIGSNQPSTSTDPWVDKYIFPGGVVPSLSQLTKIFERQRLVVEDVHNFGLYYDKTLQAWWRNFDKNYHTISDKYDERFYRMWRFYLLHFAGAFRARNLNLWQVVLRHKEQVQPYVRVP